MADAIVYYPIGYGKRLGTIDELKGYAHFYEMEPEYAQRLEAWLVSRGGAIGVGGAVRDVQPNKPGFAPDGMSFHLRQRFADGLVAFMAVDLVHRNGDNVHRAPTWAEVPRQGSGHPDIGKYYVHCNVNGEPWHMQGIEVDGFQTWVNLGRRRLLDELRPPVVPPVPEAPPGVDPTPPAPQPPVVPTRPVPPGSYTMPPLSSLAYGAPNNNAHVQVWQQMINRWFMWWGMGTTPAHGNFDEQTRNATILFQTLIRDREGRTSAVDGEVGPQSWGNVFSDC